MAEDAPVKQTMEAQTVGTSTRPPPASHAPAEEAVRHLRLLSLSLFALVVGIVNAFGNVGGAVGPTIVGWLKQTTGSVAIPFGALGVGMLLAAGLAFLLPKAPRVPSPAPAGTAPASEPEFSS